MRKASSLKLALCLTALALGATAGLAQDNREPDLTSNCASLDVGDTNKVAMVAFAVGVQIYQWNGSAWVFVAPEAVLYANEDYDGAIAIHYAGPTWESNSGGKVVGLRAAGCTPDPSAIPWLKLSAVTAEGPGIFSRVTFIQRVNTVGGIAPTTPGTAVGQQARVPYKAQYVFYRAQG
jgi:hypothetical protein